jgi:hypothetical protein
MTPAEAREYLILDGRLGVKDGSWTIDQYERFTGQKY